MNISLDIILPTNAIKNRIINPNIVQFLLLKKSKKKDAEIAKITEINPKIKFLFANHLPLFFSLTISPIQENQAGPAIFATITYVVKNISNSNGSIEVIIPLYDKNAINIIGNQRRISKKRALETIFFLGYFSVNLELNHWLIGPNNPGIELNKAITELLAFIAIAKGVI